MTAAGSEPFKWDIFLAHTDEDVDVAEYLFDLLDPQIRVYLDTRGLQLGDLHADAVPRAQRVSRITVLLISPHAGQRWYIRPEVAAALTLARKDGRRVVPVYLGPRPANVPSDLRRLASVNVPGPEDLHPLAEQLVRLVRAQTPIGQPRPGVSPAQAPAPEAEAVPPHPKEAGTPVFVLAAKKDQPHLDELRKHLYLAQKQHILFLYTAEDGDPGAVKRDAIARMDQARIILLLVSGDLFLERDDLVDRALLLFAQGSRVVPILLGDFNLKGSKLHELVALPRDHGPVSRWRDKDAAWAHVAKELRQLVESLPPS